MHIEINDYTTLRYIQEVFSDFYPYLQIEFYKKAHKKYEASDKMEVIYPGKTIGEIKKTHLSALMEIQPLNTVGQIEKEFLQRLGLSVQIFWKDRETWRQTTGLDDLTLKELNEFAMNADDESIISDMEENLD